MAVALLSFAFNGGEISELMTARADKEKYQSGCFTLFNMICLPQGPATRRPGTLYNGVVGETVLANNVRLIPFVFSSTESRVLEFCPGYVRVWMNDALVTVDPDDIDLWLTATEYIAGDYVKDGSDNVYRCIYDNTSSATDEPGVGASWATYWVLDDVYRVLTPFTSDEVMTLDYEQSADVVFLASSGHHPSKLSRYGDADWVWEEVDFIPDTEIPHGLALTNTTTVASSGSKLYKYIVTAIDAVTGEESLPSDPVSGTYDLLNKTDGNTNKIAWDGNAIEPLEYRIYKYDAGVYGYIGTVEGSASPLEFVDDNIGADTEDAPPTSEDPFIGEGNYPTIVFLWQQRLGWASSTNFPFTIWLSPSAQIESLASATPPADDDAIEARLATARADRIQWIAADRALVMGTSGNEWVIGGTDGEVLTPTTVGFSKQGSRGSENLNALPTGETLLFLQRGGHTVNEFIYDFATDKYSGPDASIIASHILDERTVSDWCYQLNSHSLVWLVLDDGTLAAITYYKDHKVLGWHRHDVGGVVESICCVPGAPFDQVWMVVRRELDGSTVRCIERFDDTFIRYPDPAYAHFVDCGLKYNGAATDTLTDFAPHLAGETVEIWADGARHPDVEVGPTGTIELEYEVEQASVGLGFVSDLQPARPEFQMADGTTVARVYKVSSAKLRLYRSMGVWAGPNEDELAEILMHDAADPLSPAFVTEDVTVVVDTGWEDEWGFLIRSGGPAPMTVKAVVYDVEVGDV